MPKKILNVKTALAQTPSDVALETEKLDINA
jgi:hypothetical protein